MPRYTPSRDGVPRVTLKLELRIDQPTVLWVAKMLGVSESAALRAIKKVLQDDAAAAFDWKRLAITNGELELISNEDIDIARTHLNTLVIGYDDPPTEPTGSLES